MKKISIISILLFLVFSLSAQNFRGGLIVGLSMSQIDGDSYSGYNKSGFLFGAVVDRKISEKLILAMEIKFLQKGSRNSYNIETGTGEYYRAKLNYIQIPLLAEYKCWKELSIQAGFGFGYLISSKEEDDNGELPDAYSFKKGEFAGIFGVSYDIPSKNIRFNLRATNSIFAVRKNPTQEMPNTYYYDLRDRGQYNRNLEFGLVYFFK